MNLDRLLKQRIREVVRPFLKEQGFTEFSDFAAWRKGERWIDVVKVAPCPGSKSAYPMPIGRYQGREILANGATFYVDLGCYYTDVHLLPWVASLTEKPRCARTESSKFPTCQRNRGLARSFTYDELDATLFPVADDGSNIDERLQDAVEALRTRGMAWLESTHDIESYLNRVGGQPGDYMDHGYSFDFTPDEQAQFLAYLRSRGIKEDACFMLDSLMEGMPANLRRKIETTRLRDSTTADQVIPYGDDLYGLLIGQGRRGAAIEKLRKDSDIAFADSQYEAMVATNPGDRDTIRTAKLIRKKNLEFLAIQRERLAMLENEVATP